MQNRRRAAETGMAVFGRPGGGARYRVESCSASARTPCHHDPRFPLQLRAQGILAVRRAFTPSWITGWRWLVTSTVVPRSVTLTT